jgi:hypothetical protein
MYLSRAEVLSIRDNYPQGTRIKLLNMIDERPIESGTLGTVTLVDDLGTIHIKWDNGRLLGVVLGEDIFEKVN